jgi:2-succinyl-5-enolpyruvyl-6-hydroxy-3-cyclohexene-1-carboxylate synthase
MCATFVDEWARAGVTHAVVAPGSRSTPMALALAADDRIALQVFHDERAAAFCALGLGISTGRPAVVLTTSGTAAAHLHAAVVEAHQAGVPMLAVTADRPPELRDVGAPQTIDQVGLYGRAVRWAVEVGVADDATRDTWRSVASRAVAEATGRRPGPVHLNTSFRDPLVADAGDQPPGRPDGTPWHQLVGGRGIVPDGALAHLPVGAHGLFVAGGNCGDPTAVIHAADALGWPVLADPRSGVAGVPHWDALLRHRPFVDAHRPDVIVRLGDAPASKMLSGWCAASGAIQIVASERWIDPERAAATMVAADPATVCAALVAALGHHPVSPEWRSAWHQAGERARQAIDAVLADHSEPTEPGVARDVVRSVPDGASLVVASSMPIRDVEWFANGFDRIRIHSNRGANGIDGTIATAIGVALGSGPTVALLGDIAFLHDSTALVGIRERGVDLVVVVIDNDGGGIFSFLPQAGALPDATFEQLFGTPHGVRVEELAAAHGITSLVVEDASYVASAVKASLESGGVWLVVARTDRVANVKLHDELNAAVAAAL